MSLLGLISALFLFSFSFSQETEIYTIVKGIVREVFVKKGQHVRPGQMLVDIDPTLYVKERERLKAELEIQRLNLEKVEWDFKRYEELFNRDLLSKSDYEKWKNKYHVERAKYSSLLAQVEKLDTLIEYCRIKSPIKGVVKRVYVKKGTFVNGSMVPQVLLVVQERE